MSDNIPFELQMEIIEKVSHVKSLIRFRSVSKQWKSFIDSPDFIKGYGARHTEPHSRILSYLFNYIADEVKYFRLVDDDYTNSIKVQQELAPAVVSPLIKQFSITQFVGASHGLVCLYGHTENMLVIWNPSVWKSFGIADPNHLSSSCNIYGFGVCPNTSDPTVVKIIQRYNKPWHVEVFTLSSGVWNVIPISNLLCQLSKLTLLSRVVIDRFIYWVACKMAFAHSYNKYKVVSFDLITKEFKLVHLPDFLTCERHSPVSICKLRESLVVYGSINVGGGAESCVVWVMEHDLSFRKLFSISVWVQYWGLWRVVNLYLTLETSMDSWPNLLFMTPAHSKLRILGFLETGAHSSWTLTMNRYFYLITRIYMYIKVIIDKKDDGHI
ncbi:probable galacturonosyltransferase 7 isoform X2 [Tanacetum coccineum]